MNRNRSWGTYEGHYRRRSAAPPADIIKIAPRTESRDYVRCNFAGLRRHESNTASDAPNTVAASGSRKTR
jgi:hypothetical protein